MCYSIYKVFPDKAVLVASVPRQFLRELINTINKAVLQFLICSKVRGSRTTRMVNMSTVSMLCGALPVHLLTRHSFVSLTCREG